ncbi:transcriptional regulator [Flavobacterium sufflavum]|uniref:Transcriptional regulator n=1 Tax=Flavobacterium sufflavum TaxID=1921138 RepID=A0A3S2U324_9FLAO|nr:transcriptional regulator [Flavobacterium sufflavum]RVT76700.1 transcriptional regulator [Flavobacterium sufflavum]
MTNNKTKHSQNRGDQYPLVGNFIHYHIMQQPETKTDIAKALGILPKGLGNYFKRDTLQFAVLWKLSLVLKHNFIAQLGEYLPYRFETIREKALKEELAEKNAHIQKLEIQLETLREIIRK